MGTEVEIPITKKEEVSEVDELRGVVSKLASLKGNNCLKMATSILNWEAGDTVSLTELVEEAEELSRASSSLSGGMNE